MSLRGLHIHAHMNGEIWVHAINYVTLPSWVNYNANIGPIYPLDLMFTKVAWNIINFAFS